MKRTPPVGVNWSNYEANMIFLETSGLVSKKKKLLDIGCGVGNIVNSFSMKGYNIIGIDVNETFISQSRTIFGDLPVKKMSGDNLKFKDNSFDVVFSFDVFEHIHNSNKHLEEVKRVLTNGGYYLLSTPNKWTNVPYSILKNKSFTKYKRHHCSLHNYWELIRRFRENGFSIELIDVPVVNHFFKRKIKAMFGNIGIMMLRFFHPDYLPLFLRTNFFVIAKVKK